jgi:hypothetical protein
MSTPLLLFDNCWSDEGFIVCMIIYGIHKYIVCLYIFHSFTSFKLSLEIMHLPSWKILILIFFLGVWGGFISL